MTDRFDQYTEDRRKFSQPPPAYDWGEARRPESRRRGPVTLAAPGQTGAGGATAAQP
jgi:hypothetical protein